jgi:hypothetical protein
MLLPAPEPDDPRLAPLPLLPGEPFPSPSSPMLVEVIGGGLCDPPGDGMIPIFDLRFSISVLALPPLGRVTCRVPSIPWRLENSLLRAHLQMRGLIPLASAAPYSFSACGWSCQGPNPTLGLRIPPWGPLVVRTKTTGLTRF